MWTGHFVMLQQQAAACNSILYAIWWSETIKCQAQSQRMTQQRHHSQFSFCPDDPCPHPSCLCFPFFCCSCCWSFTWMAVSRAAEIWKAAVRSDLQTGLSRWIFSGTFSTYINAVFPWNREHAFFTAWRAWRKLWGLVKWPINKSTLIHSRLVIRFLRRLTWLGVLGNGDDQGDSDCLLTITRNEQTQKPLLSADRPTN